MTFFFDTAWWIMLVVATIIIIGLAYREAMRFRSLINPYGKLIAYGATLAVLFWLLILILMAFHTGVFSAIVGFLISFVIGIVSLNIIKRHFTNFTHEFLAKSEWDDRMIKFAVTKSVNTQAVQLVMKEHSVNEADIEELYHRLRRAGVEDNKVNSAILNPDLIAWYFKQVRDASTNLEDLAIKLGLYARYDKKPQSE